MFLEDCHEDLFIDHLLQIYIPFLDEFHIIRSNGIILFLEGPCDIGEGNDVSISLVLHRSPEFFEYYFDPIIEGDEFHCEFERARESEIRIVSRNHFALKSELTGIPWVACKEVCDVEFEHKN